MPGVLHVSAVAPDPDALGGVAIHVAALAGNAPGGVVVHTAHPHAGTLRVTRWGEGERLAAILPLPGGDEGALSDGLAAAIVGTSADVLHIHSPMLGAAALTGAIRRTGVRAIVTLHDGALVSENHALLEGGERYCGVPEDLARCDACLAATLGRPAGSIQKWRLRMGELVGVADLLVAPSPSVLADVAKVHPGAPERARLVPWGVPPPRVRTALSARAPGPLRVAVVGVFAKVKGAGRLPQLLAACRDLDVEFHLFGATEGASLGAVRKSGARVVAHGAYHRGALAERIVQSGCHVALLASIAAESFSLTLSEVTAIGLPVVASDLGALGERVRTEALGWLFDPWEPSTLRRALSEATSERGLVDAAAERVRARPVRTEVDMARDHADLVRAVAALGPRPGGEGPLERSRLEAAYASGAALAAKEKPSLLARAAHVLRKTDMYRDLRLRTLLPEKTRLAIESWAERLSSGRRAP